MVEQTNVATNVVALPTARAASLRPQPASPFSQSGIANAAGGLVLLSFDAQQRQDRILSALFGDAR